MMCSARYSAPVLFLSSEMKSSLSWSDMPSVEQSPTPHSAPRRQYLSWISLSFLQALNMYHQRDLKERKQTLYVCFLLLFVLLGLLEQVLQHLGLLEPVIELGVLLLVLRLRAQQEDMVSISQEGQNGTRPGGGQGLESTPVPRSRTGCRRSLQLADKNVLGISLETPAANL